MSDLLAIAGNAVMAYQRALGTVSNNIANVATDGYSRQEVALVSSAPTQVGNSFIGTGVTFDRVQRQYDAFAESNLRNSNADLQSQEPMVTYANRVIDVMGGQSMGLVSAMDQFFASANSLSSNPASTVLRGAFLRDSQGLASRFGELSTQLDLIDSETRQAVASGVGEINTLGQQLAQVNKQLSKITSVDRQPAELLDQRDLLLGKLSEFSRLNTRFKANGEVSVSLGASMAQDVIVEGSVATVIGVDAKTTGSDKINLVRDPFNNPVPLNGLSSGKIAGLLAFREQVLGSTRNNLDYLATSLAKAVNGIHSQGIDAYGEPAGDLFSFKPQASSAASGLQVAIDDPLRIAAAAQFRVIKGANNAGSADALVSYQASDLLGPSPLPQALSNSANASAARLLVIDASQPLAPVATIPGGLQDVVIDLAGADSGQQLQFITRDGRHLLGQPLDADMQSRLMTPEQGVSSGATYSASYLNKSGSLGYQGLTVFYGARAGVRQQQTFDSQGNPSTPVNLPAVLAGGRIAANQTGSMAAGALALNGVALGVLAPAAGTLQAGDIAAWVTRAGVAGVTATAHNEVRAPVAALKLDRALRLNNIDIGSSFASPAALVQAINSQSADTGVLANIANDGDLVLTNVSSQPGQDIKVDGVVGNALNIASTTYTGQVDIQRAVVSGQDTPVEISFGAGAGPADLARLGFRTSATIKGTVPEDVLVFVTGAGAAAVSATYTGAAANPAAALRAQPMTLTFTAADRYTITDNKTGSVLAERSFNAADLNAAIGYRGLNLSFTTAPKVGDTFVLDGNKDGTGNNENMLRLAALQTSAVVGGKTISGAYIDHVNDMGNVSRQASIAREALTVVHDQAVVARDQVSGVTLDEEAANLIRFQQAYQASAKVMQTASALFDAVLAIR